MVLHMYCKVRPEVFLKLCWLVSQVLTCQQPLQYASLKHNLCCLYGVIQLRFLVTLEKIMTLFQEQQQQRIC